MDQLLWMWSLLPQEIVSWVFNLIILAGIIGMLAGKLARWIPFFGVYVRPLKYLGLVLLLGGMFLKGGEINNAAWEAKVKEVEEKLKVAEAKSQQINTVVEEKIVEKTKVIQGRTVKQIEYLEKIVKGETVKETVNMTEEQKAEYEKQVAELKKSIENCPIPKLLIDAHNQAAQPVGDKK